MTIFKILFFCGNGFRMADLLEILQYTFYCVTIIKLHLIKLLKLVYIENLAESSALSLFIYNFLFYFNLKCNGI